MFATIYTDNLVHLGGFKINHFIMSENRIRNLLNIDFIDSEQARNFKHYINYCDIFNKGCNLVLFNSNFSEQILFHDVKIIKSQIPFVDNILLDMSRYSKISGKSTSEQLIGALKDLIDGDYKSFNFKSIIDKILEGE